jgi:NDP-glycosyltransferase
MTKYVILTMPGYGLVNPTLAIAQELVKRGQEVIYYLPEQFRDEIQAIGASLRSYDSKMKDTAPTNFSANSTAMSLVNTMMTRMIDEAHYVLPQVLDRIHAEQADVIVDGGLSEWVRIVVKLLKKPTISLHTTYVMNEHFNFHLFDPQQQSQGSVNMSEDQAKVSASITELRAAYHLPAEDFHSAFQPTEQLNLVFLPKEFQPKADTFDKRTLFVGPSILPRKTLNDFPFERLKSEQPLLYISLGTIANNQPEFFRMCFEAFEGQSWQVVLSYGRRIDPTTLGPIPDNFLIAPYVPQLDILPRTRVFVTHCGMNSVMESLYYGVPIVAIPQMIEQAVSAQRIRELELGIELEKDTLNTATLREAVERVANESVFRENARKMQQITHAAGGYQRAVDAIMQFAETRPRVTV